MAGHHLRREDFAVGWVSALPIELAAARKMLDQEYDYNYDDSTYTLGRMGEHNIVIACFPAGQLGISTGAMAAADMKSKFPALEFCLMVGIGGGVPSLENDIRLGDVVISKPEGIYGGVVQYDLGKTVSGGHQLRTGFLNAPPAAILKTVARFQSNHALEKDSMSAYLSQLERTQFDWRKAGPDVLFQSSYGHKPEGLTCADCPQEMIVPRLPRTGSRTVTIHYGTIASGNQVMKDAITRDRLSSELGGVLCFEMEAAGLMNNMPCLVIRGISDYSDSHKNSSWQPYAAATAAACAKEILRLHPTNSGLKQRKEILDWIASPEQEQTHSFVTGPRVHGTGRWLLEHAKYTEWRDDLAKSNVLWCYGMEGSGKTVLVSTVIDDLRNRLSAKGVPVTFFYLDYEHQARQTMAYFLKSLLRQLLDHIPHIPKPLVEAFSRLGGSECSLSATVLEKIILEVMQSSSQIYVLIDALDECIELGRRKAIISFLEQAARSAKIRLLLTSRPHVQEIRSTFENSHQILVRASEADIGAYVSQEISRARVTDIADTSFVQRIMDTIIHQAEGMFLLSVLRTKTVLREPTAGDMEDSLRSLAKDLPEVFRETVSRIQKLPENQKRLGMMTLMFLSHAKRPIVVQELTDFLSVQLGQTTVRLRHRPLPRVVLECCLGLASIEPTTETVRLSHYAVNEYLVRNSYGLFADAEASISALCLTYLLLDPFTKGPRTEEEEIDDLLEQCPFASYAAARWGDHVRLCERSPTVSRLAVRFLRNQQATACSIQIMQYDRNYQELYWTPKECYSANALHIASDFGLENLVLTLLAQNAFKLDATTTIGTTAITKAASSGRVSVVRALLQKGANPYLENWYGNALHCAAEAGHCNTIRELISCGMDPNYRSAKGRLALDCALDRDNAEAFETLVAFGARLNNTDGGDRPILIEAVHADCVNIVDLILNRGWVDVNCCSGDGATAAHTAAAHDNTVILAKLMKAGANINAGTDTGLTPLDYALRYQCDSAAKLLQAYGATSFMARSRYPN
ncbi:hypothetical protein BJY00DRAFT_113978 [Aspergillus carlsbadensis]|nr:hypothetical protein BJY00DRAFT_113978 [Aspergillus carlsbadensis]